MTRLQYALAVLLVGTSWTFEPIPAIGILALALLYASGVHRLRLRNRKWSRNRSIPFIAGLIALAVATLSPLASRDTEYFSAHVVQHLLLAMVAPPLILLGAPVTLWLQASSRPVQERTLAVLHSRLVRMISFPLVAWMLFAGTLFVLYFSPLYELSLRNVLFHDFVHFHFVAAGLLFFAPIVAIDPIPHRMPHGARLLYMGLTLPVHAFLALALLSATNPLAVDWYVVATGHSVAQILSDQKLGAGIMWISGDLLSISTVAIVVLQWVRDDEREAAREDRYVATHLTRLPESSSQR
jgi:putative membrane protein